MALKWPKYSTKMHEAASAIRTTRFSSINDTYLVQSFPAVNDTREQCKLNLGPEYYAIYLAKHWESKDFEKN
jgi:hypothetical protein